MGDTRRCTNSLRDSSLRERLISGRGNRDRHRRQAEGPPVLRIEVSSTSSKAGVFYEYGCRHPAASPHDRGHECAEALCGYAERPHPQLQAVCRVSPSLPRHGHDRGYPPLPVALGRSRREHLQSQPHHDRAAVLVPRHTRRLDLANEVYHIREPQKIPLVMSPDETRACSPSPAASRSARCSVSAMVAASAPAKWSG